jgi:hypothetical protein
MIMRTDGQDLDSGEPVLGPLTGHASAVNAVAVNKWTRLDT